MALLMRDSIQPGAIPLDNLTAVAGYGDGRWAWSSDDWARFQPPIVSLSIVISAQNAGDILDVETGDASPADVPGWVKRFNRPGRRKPTIYSSRSTWSRQSGSPALTITEALANAGISPSAVDWWAATLDGVTAIVPGAVAVQYAGSTHTGGDYDESTILDPSWVGEPVPVSPGGAQGGTTMIAFRPDRDGVVDRHDMVFVVKNGTDFVHAWASSISDPTAGAGEETWGVPQGKTLVANTAFAAWDSTGDWIMWGVQATDGSWWYGWGNIDSSNQSGWKPLSNYSSDVPGAASASFIAHKHTTDGGTPS